MPKHLLQIGAKIETILRCQQFTIRYIAAAGSVDHLQGGVSPFGFARLVSMSDTLFNLAFASVADPC